MILQDIKNARLLLGDTEEEAASYKGIDGCDFKSTADQTLMIAAALGNCKTRVFNAVQDKRINTLVKTITDDVEEYAKESNYVRNYDFPKLIQQYVRENPNLGVTDETCKTVFGIMQEVELAVHTHGFQNEQRYTLVNGPSALTTTITAGLYADEQEIRHCVSTKVNGKEELFENVGHLLMIDAILKRNSL